MNDHIKIISSIICRYYWELLDESLYLNVISNVQMCDNLKRRKVKRLRENKKKKENFGIIYNLSIFQNFLKFLFSFLIVTCP